MSILNNPMPSTVAGALLALCLGLFGGTVQAANVDGLYQAETPVEGQGTEQRNLAIRDAFAKVLVKVTGSRRALERPDLAAELKAAPRYVQEYRYRLAPESPSAATDEPPAGEAEPPAPAQPQRLLLVHFDHQAVNRLLRAHGLPVWGGNRPAGLIWLGMEQGGVRRLLTGESDPEPHAALAAAADERGLPILFPLMDLEDQMRLQVADVWGNFEENIRRASARYRPDLILTGRIVRLDENLWRAHWQLYQGDYPLNWSDEGAEAASLAAAGLDHMADLLAERYAPLSGDGSHSRIRLMVTGIADLRDYAGVTRFLQSQSSIEEVVLAGVQPDALIYELLVRGGVQVLQQGLELGGMLEPGDANGGLAPGSGSGVDIHYRLR